MPNFYHQPTFASCNGHAQARQVCKLASEIAGHNRNCNLILTMENPVPLECSCGPDNHPGEDIPPTPINPFPPRCSNCLAYLIQDPKTLGWYCPNGH